MRSKSLLWSFNYAIDGIAYALRTQRNMRIHVGAAMVVLVASLFLRIERAEFLAVVFAVAFVLVTELINTAVEATVDIITDTFEPLAKVAKDVAAGAVFVSAIMAMVVGYIVFFTRLTHVTDTLLIRVRETPLHITLVALVVTALAVLVMKAFRFEGGTWVRGGWPSGHTALAAAAAASIGYITGSAPATVISLSVAALVAQSRVESDAHTVPQVVWGGAVGLLITTIIFQLFWI
ncbi:MAG: diacylglycerol kinase [Coriobacteriia bacterium]|nr:diacylglycerol kinase [Coriobacteriia bacterium]